MAEITVKLDIAGFYFSVVRKCEEGLLLSEFMSRVAGRVITSSDGQNCIFNYSTAPGIGNPNKIFVNRIGITFLDAPRPRQDGLAEGLLQLQPGLYAAQDETRVATAAGVAELTWQYYANAATFANDKLELVGEVLNREPGATAGTRRVIPFSEYRLTRDSLITWRLIAIMVAGDPLPTPVAMAATD